MDILFRCLVLGQIGLAGLTAAEEPTLVDLAGQAVVTSIPYCGTLRYLTDGLVPDAQVEAAAGSGPFFETGEIGSRGSITTYACFPFKSSGQSLTFTFPRPMALSTLRGFQLGAHARSCAIAIDPEGTGRFIPWRRLEGLEPMAWFSAGFDGPPLRAVRLTFSDPSGKGAPQLGEIQLLAPATEAGPAGPPEVAGLPPLRFQLPVRPDPPPRQEGGYRFGAVCSLWMLLDQSSPYEPSGVRPGALARIRELGLDRLRMFPGLKPSTFAKVTLPEDPRYRARVHLRPAPGPGGKLGEPGLGTSCMPWPSRVLMGYADNVLARLTRDLAVQGLELAIIPPRNVAPFDPRSGFFPMAQPELHQPAVTPPFPCVWHGRYWEDAFSTILGEIAASGVAALDVVPDEFYIEGHDLRRLPADDPCRELFRQEHGCAVPEQPADSEAYRRWILFGYDSTARLFGRLNAAVKAAAPHLTTETNLSVAPLLDYRAGGFSLAYDLIGHTAGIDVLGTDPYFRGDTLGHWQIPKQAALFQGATPGRRTTMMLQAVCGDFKTPFNDPLWAVGPATSLVLRGVRNLDFYRLDYFADLSDDRSRPNPAWPFYRDWIAMIRRLEALGLAQARAPQDLAFLYSRAGADWWELAESMKTGSATYPLSAMAGHAHHDAVMGLLFERNLPFDLFYLDQPSSLAGLNRYRTAIIPFAYSISSKAFASLESALAAGTRLVIVAHSGETDEFGNAQAVPLLATLRGRPGVTFLDLDLLVDGTRPEVQEVIAQAVRPVDGPAVEIQTGRYAVEAGALRHADGTWFVPLVNWDERPATVTLGFPGAVTPHTVIRHALEGDAPAADGPVPAASLRRFSVSLARHESVVLTLRPIGTMPPLAAPETQENDSTRAVPGKLP